jgi:hypothetical protein
MSLIIVIKRKHKAPRPISAYSAEVRVTVSSTELRTIEELEEVRHRRDDGWPILVARFLKKYHPEALEQVRNELRSE